MLAVVSVGTLILHSYGTSGLDKVIPLGIIGLIPLAVVPYLRRVMESTASLDSTAGLGAAPSLPATSGAGKSLGSWLEITTGILLIAPASWFLHYLFTDPHAGDLMIFGAMVGLGALVAIILGVTLVVGGAWGVLRLPGRAWAHGMTLVVGTLGGYMLLRWVLGE